MGLDRAQHRRRADIGHRHVAEHREGILLQRVRELRAVLGVLPFAFVLIEIVLRGLAKDQQLGLGGGHLAFSALR